MFAIALNMKCSSLRPLMASASASCGAKDGIKRRKSSVAARIAWWSCLCLLKALHFGTSMHSKHDASSIVRSLCVHFRHSVNYEKRPNLTEMWCNRNKTSSKLENLFRLSSVSASQRQQQANEKNISLSLSHTIQIWISAMLMTSERWLRLLLGSMKSTLPPSQPRFSIAVNEMQALRCKANVKQEQNRKKHTNWRLVKLLACSGNFVLFSVEQF